MDKNERTSTDSKAGERKAKRPYERPQIVWRDRIEARAVECAKAPAQPNCGAGPLTS